MTLPLLRRLGRDSRAVTIIEFAMVAPVMLLGEATFHQFHGGVATNVPRAEHPWARMAAEYEAIRGKPYANEGTRPDYAGWLSPRYHAALMP